MNFHIIEGSHIFVCPVNKILFPLKKNMLNFLLFDEEKKQE